MPTDPTPATATDLPEAELATLPPGVQASIRRMGWTELTAVQARTIPYVLAGRDLMVQSRTGTGKTGAFLLPILERIKSTEASCQALIMVPTRELARQVLGEAEMMTQGTDFRVAAVYGGVGYGPQLEALRRGAHVVVGTPGRILDHLMRRSLDLDHVRVLVFDEADRMLSAGFYPDMKALDTYLPRKRDGFMFSATYPPSVISLSRQFLKDPEMLSLSHGAVHVAETEHVFYEVPGLKKDRSLVRIIEVENPESAIIFCNTRENTRYVSVVLQRFGYDADLLSADLDQKARDKVLKRVYEKKLRFLVATDVAARGIDIQNLSHVINFDFPEDPESYVHRVGRTGRMGASGEAISLVDMIEKLKLATVARRYEVDIQERELPTDEDVARVVTDRVTNLLETKLRSLDRLVQERLERMIPLAGHLAENEDERRLVAMLLDEYYHRALHEPADVPFVVPERSEPPPRDRSKEEASSRERAEDRSGGRAERGRKRKRR